MLIQPNKTAIFSGRFDPPHLGHLITIMDIADQFGRVVVVVLDYPERESVKSDEAAHLFNTVFDQIFPSGLRSKVEIVINATHFGQITFSQYDSLLRNLGLCYNHSVYLSGNYDVLKNMHAQGIKSMYYPRSFDNIYSGTAIRQQKKSIDNGLEISLKKD